MNNRISKNKIALFAILLCFVMIFTSFPTIASMSSFDEKLTDALVSNLADLKSDDTVDVIIWRKGVDIDEIEKQAFAECGIPDNAITDELGIETIQNFISVKRDLIRQEYEKTNSAFVKQMLSSAKNIEVLYDSKISPVTIVSMPKSELSKAIYAKNNSIDKIDLFVNSVVQSESNIANQNTGTANLRDTSSINATGKGIKIGMVEDGVPNINLMYNGNRYFNTSKVFPQAQVSVTTHANLVAAIMVGQPITYGTVTYRGIAPDAELYANYFNTTLSFYTAVENLLTQSKVNVINMSARAANPGLITAYDSVSQWVDHIAFVHDVHFVKSAGNDEKNDRVTTPGLAYNAIVVGSLGDNNQSIGALAPATLATQSLNSNFQTSYFSNSHPTLIKPDLLAYGEDIAYGNIFINGSNVTGNDGTSFAAPQVTATIAQLCEKNPSLLTQQVGMKALLSTTAVYRPNNIGSTDRVANSDLYRRMGSGIIGARTAYVTRQAGKYWESSISTATKSININVPSSYSYIRIGLSWIKKNSIDSSHTTVNDRLLADLKLELYYNGVLVATSDTSTNAELIQYEVTQYGTYTIKITNKDFSKGGDYTSQYIAVVWY